MPGRLLDGVEREPGNVTAPVLCESVDSGLLDTTLESFDLHYAVKTTLNPGPKDTGWMTEEQKAGG
ncbi:hypothetical protein DEJ49_32100 [Streptomyces venezuelae]|uniref:Uncharacterized protein n=1 Tax=Streptomyces venezuelae TaxID=54571 RepID=A0A5P2CV98_STRVZ|nr:hypothetical protein DEJ49_32100 [Streptomyces venezuelae]